MCDSSIKQTAGDVGEGFIIFVCLQKLVRRGDVNNFGH